MKHSAIACLKRLPVFTNLSNNALEKIVPISAHRIHYHKGELIATPDSDSKLIDIDQGKAKVYTLSEDGKEKILYIANQGTIDGQENLFEKETVPKYMEALENTWVCSIKHDDFQELMKKTPALSADLLNNFGLRLVNMERDSARRDLMDSKERIYQYLLDLSHEKNQTTFKLPVSKKDLANILSITPETLSRQLKKLVQEGKIKVNKRVITIE